MSSTKPPKGAGNQQNKGWVNVKSNTSPNRRKRRRKKNKNKNTNNKTKTISTKPKHAAPPNASTIYCQWFQEGLCQRGKECFFIHELDPLSEKNPIQHKAMLKELLEPTDTIQYNTSIQIPLKKHSKPSKPMHYDEFLLPSQNQEYQQQIQTTNHIQTTNYNRYSDFVPNTKKENTSNIVSNPDTETIETLKFYADPKWSEYVSDATESYLNANATAFVPNYNNNNTHQTDAYYNPYLTANNAHTANPYDVTSSFMHQNESKLNVDHGLMNDPTSFNEDDYEVWEDENGEIIVVEKDQLYGDDPSYQNEKMVKQYNNNNNEYMQQKGIRSGGDTYCYGSAMNNMYKEEEKKEIIKDGNKSNYSSIASRFSRLNIGKVESVDNDNICRFFINSSCLYGDNCKMAHRFETDKCPHCSVTVGPSAIIQQQHLSECLSKIALDEEVKISVNIECGICKDIVLNKGGKFGLLTGCEHSFCLKCIREWRGVLHQSKEVVRSCPICRQKTWFIVPCDRFVCDPKRKKEIIQKYKERLSEIRCKHFDEDETCPFGTSCFYKHIRKDGSIDDKKVSLRHMINEDGETQIMKQMQLSEFLFGNTTD